MSQHKRWKGPCLPYFTTYIKPFRNNVIYKNVSTLTIALNIYQRQSTFMITKGIKIFKNAVSQNYAISKSRNLTLTNFLVKSHSGHLGSHLSHWSIKNVILIVTTSGRHLIVLRIAITIICLLYLAIQANAIAMLPFSFSSTYLSISLGVSFGNVFRALYWSSINFSHEKVTLKGNIELVTVRMTCTFTLFCMALLV